jgi:hypothetical protein
MAPLNESGVNGNGDIENHEDSNGDLVEIEREL